MGGGSGSKVSNGSGFGGTKGGEPIGCFVAGTLIYTEHGYRPIEEIQTGDLVWSENIETGEKDIKPVINTFTQQKDTLINLYINDILIETTSEHPFWVEGEQWVFAGELEYNKQLKSENGELLEISLVGVANLVESVTVYNLEVDDWHTYYVSGLGVLVHNKAMKNLEMVSKNQLKNLGINAHKLKKNAGIDEHGAHHDIYKNKDTKELVVMKKGGKGEPISTDIYVEGSKKQEKSPRNTNKKSNNRRKRR